MLSTQFMNGCKTLFVKTERDEILQEDEVSNAHSFIGSRSTQSCDIIHSYAAIVKAALIRKITFI